MNAPNFSSNDRLSFMWFLGLGLEDRFQHARTIWLFREKLTTAGAIKRLSEQFDAMLRQAGYIAMSGQIVDASLVAAPRQRNTDDEKKAIKEGRIPLNWKAKPARCGTRIATRAGRSNSPRPNRARMAQRRQSIWQSRYLAIRTMSRSISVSASSADGRPQMRLRMRAVVCAKACSTRAIRRAGWWADIAYRSAANETFLNKNGFVSHIHRKKPKGRAMHETMRRANNAKSKIRSRVEHMFAEQKDRMGLFIRTIGIARATTKIGMANLVYNIKRFIFLRKIAIA